MWSCTPGGVSPVCSPWGAPTRSNFRVARCPHRAPRATLPSVANDDLRARVKAAIRRVDQTEQRARQQRADRNALIKEAVDAGVMTVVEVYKSTPLSKTQVERIVRGNTSGAQEVGHAASSDDA